MRESGGLGTGGGDRNEEVMNGFEGGKTGFKEVGSSG